jgi:hypothetical protein
MDDKDYDRNKVGSLYTMNSVKTQQNINTVSPPQSLTSKDLVTLLTPDNLSNALDKLDDITKSDFKNKTHIKFKRKKRYIIFVIFMITNLVMNMDHGIMPACTKEIKDDLDIEETMLGLFGSMVYFGNFLGIFIL